MPCSKITNNSNFEVDKHKPMFDSFFPYSQKVLGFDKQFSLNFASDQENSANPLGKTAHYDPSSSAITIYVDGRHIKDIMRSISHELVHHAQNCRGEFDKGVSTDAGYAQTDDHLRGMESEAYEKGNLCFRDWEDQYKQLRENKMIKLVKKEIKKLLKEQDPAWYDPYNMYRSGGNARQPIKPPAATTNKDPAIVPMGANRCPRSHPVPISDTHCATSESADGAATKKAGPDQKAPTAAKAAKASRICKRNIKKGCQGRNVKALQTLLNKFYAKSAKAGNYTPLETRTGIFGRQTKNVVLGFQRQHKLKPDGIVGGKTMGILKDKTAALGSGLNLPKGSLADKGPAVKPLDKDIVAQRPAGKRAKTIPSLGYGLKRESKTIKVRKRKLIKEAMSEREMAAAINGAEYVPELEKYKVLDGTGFSWSSVTGAGGDADFEEEDIKMYAMHLQTIFAQGGISEVDEKARKKLCGKGKNGYFIADEVGDVDNIWRIKCVPKKNESGTKRWPDPEDVKQITKISAYGSQEEVYKEFLYKMAGKGAGEKQQEKNKKAIMVNAAKACMDWDNDGKEASEWVPEPFNQPSLKGFKCKDQKLIKPGPSGSKGVDRFCRTQKSGTLVPKRDGFVCYRGRAVAAQHVRVTGKCPPGSFEAGGEAENPDGTVTRDCYVLKGKAPVTGSKDPASTASTTAPTGKMRRLPIVGEIQNLLLQFWKNNKAPNNRYAGKSTKDIIGSNKVDQKLGGKTLQAIQLSPCGQGSKEVGLDPVTKESVMKNLPKIKKCLQNLGGQQQESKVDFTQKHIEPVRKRFETLYEHLIRKK